MYAIVHICQNKRYLLTLTAERPSSGAYGRSHFCSGHWDRAVDPNGATCAGRTSHGASDCTSVEYSATRASDHRHGGRRAGRARDAWGITSESKRKLQSIVGDAEPDYNGGWHGGCDKCDFKLVGQRIGTEAREDALIPLSSWRSHVNVLVDYCYSALLG